LSTQKHLFSYPFTLKKHKNEGEKEKKHNQINRIPEHIRSLGTFSGAYPYTVSFDRKNQPFSGAYPYIFREQFILFHHFPEHVRSPDRPFCFPEHTRSLFGIFILLHSINKQ
jgi:hypothetical protein